MYKISLVIPTYTVTQELEDIAFNCATSYRDFVGQLVITEDGGMKSDRLKSIADKYLYHDNVGFSKNVNIGWKHAEGEYVMIVNSDTYLVSGNLSSLCIPGKVTSPMIENQHVPTLAGAFWCTPSDVGKEYKYLKEDMKLYYSDNEYSQRVDSIFEKVPGVIINHLQATTVKNFDNTQQEEKDKQVYYQKYANNI